MHKAYSREKGGAFANCSAPGVFVDGFGKNETKGKFLNEKVVSLFRGFTVCVDFPLVNLHASASSSALGQETYRRVPYSFPKRRCCRDKDGKKPLSTWTFEGQNVTLPRI